MSHPLIFDSEINKWMDEDTAKQVRLLREQAERPATSPQRLTNKIGRTYRFKPAK